MCPSPSLNEFAHTLFVDQLPCDIKTADATELRKAFRQLALRHHPDKRGKETTALFQAISVTYEELVRNVDSPARESIPKREKNPVAVAAGRGLVEEVKELLHQRPWLAHEADSFGVDPLMVAASGGCVEVVALLLSLGADLHARTPFQWTVLAYAALGNHAAMVRFLCEQGLPVTEAELHLAAYAGNPESLRALLEFYKGPSQILARDGNGRTLLHYAVDGMCNLRHSAERHAECVSIALQWQGSVNAVESKKGRTCLHDYVANPRWRAKGLEDSVVHLQVLEQLCAAGASVTAEDWQNASALALAKSMGLIHVREVLYCYA